MFSRPAQVGHARANGERTPHLQVRSIVAPKMCGDAATVSLGGGTWKSLQQGGPAGLSDRATHAAVSGVGAYRRYGRVGSPFPLESQAEGPCP